MIAAGRWGLGCLRGTGHRRPVAKPDPRGAGSLRVRLCLAVWVSVSLSTQPQAPSPSPSAAHGLAWTTVGGARGPFSAGSPCPQAHVRFEERPQAVVGQRCLVSDPCAWSVSSSVFPARPRALENRACLIPVCCWAQSLAHQLWNYLLNGNLVQGRLSLFRVSFSLPIWGSFIHSGDAVRC